MGDPIQSTPAKTKVGCANAFQNFVCECCSELRLLVPGFLLARSTLTEPFPRPRPTSNTALIQGIILTCTLALRAYKRELVRHLVELDAFYHREIQPLVSSMIEAVLIERPDDVRLFLVNFLQTSQTAHGDVIPVAVSSDKSDAVAHFYSHHIQPVLVPFCFVS